MGTLLAGPVLSIVLIVLAGIALRYALWYRGDDKSREDEINDFLQRINVLQSEKKDLQGKLRQLQGEISDLEEVNESMQQTNRQLHDTNRATHASREELQQALEDRDAQLQKSQDQHAQLHSQYKSLGEAHDKLKSHSQRQQSSVSDIERSLRTLREESERQRQELEAALADARQSGEMRQSELAAARQAVEELTAQRDDLQIQLQAYHEQVIGLEDSVRESEGAIAGLEVDARFARALKEKQSSLQDKLRESIEQVTSLSAERQQLALRLSDTEQQLSELRRHVQAHQEKNHQLKQESTESRAAREEIEVHLGEARTEIADLRRLLQTHQDRIHGLEDERQLEVGQRDQQLAELQADRDTVSTRVRELEDEVAQQQNRVAAELERIARLQQEKNILLDRLQREQDERANLESFLEESHAEKTVLLEQTQQVKAALLEQLQGERDNRASVEADLHQSQQRIANLVDELEQLNHWKAAHEHLEHQVSGLDANVNRLATEREQLTSALARAEQQVRTLQDESNQLQEQVAGLKVDIDRDALLMRELRIEKEQALTHLEQERNERTLVQNDLLRHLETLERLRSDSQSLESLLERQAAVQVSLREHADRLRRMASETDREAELAESHHSDGAERNVIPMTVSAPRTGHDANPGSVGKSRPQYCDDLKRISGIGELLEEKLNQLGIYTFEQIMNWDDATVADISERLAFKDRIVREQWVVQARRLHHETHRAAA